MNLRQLRYFLAIVDHGGVHRAAEALLIAQSSLSQTMRALERDLGTELSRQQDHVAPIRTSSDASEGARAFIEKREPAWSGS